MSQRKPRVLHLNCRGCGQPLGPQKTVSGSVFLYHTECQAVRRIWDRLVDTNRRKERYRELRAAGAFRSAAVYGSAGQARFEGTMAALMEGA